MLIRTYKSIGWDRMGQGQWKKRTGCKEVELLGKRGRLTLGSQYASQNSV